MENLNNLPPFYVGQKLIYTGWKKELKGTIHIVSELIRQGCGCWHVISKTLPLGQYNFCYYCSCFVESNCLHNANAKSFSPLQESPFPSLTMKEVVKEESKLVSLN